MKEKETDRAQIIEILREKSSFLITFHDSPSGDAIGSGLALGFLLERLGKEVVIRNADPVPLNLLFLPGVDKISRGFELKKPPQVAVVLDCANIGRIGAGSDTVKKFDIIVNIDHHVSNDFFGMLNYVDAGAGATGEQIFSLFEELLPGDIWREPAICLYTSIVMDTGLFQHKNTKPRTHEIIAILLGKGVDASSVAREVYGNFSLANRKLLGLTLADIQLSNDGKIAWLKVSGDMYQKADAQETDAHNFIDYIHLMKGVSVSLLLRELKDGNVKVSFRSRLVDVNRIADVFGGGGHPGAAGCIVKGQMADVEKKVIAAVQKTVSRES